MKYTTSTLLENLVATVDLQINFIGELNQLSHDQLKYRMNDSSWNILECVEHLVRYANFYVPEMKNKLECAPNQITPFFKSGIIGNYFAQSMLPKVDRKPMNTFKEMNPLHTKVDATILNIFIQQLHQINQLLELAKHKNINTIKTNISITTLIKLKIGDTFRFVINHQERHIAQINRILDHYNMS